MSETRCHNEFRGTTCNKLLCKDAQPGTDVQIKCPRCGHVVRVQSPAVPKAKRTLKRIYP